MTVSGTGKLWPANVESGREMRKEFTTGSGLVPATQEAGAGGTIGHRYGALPRSDAKVAQAELDEEIDAGTGEEVGIEAVQQAPVARDQIGRVLEPSITLDHALN